MIGIFDSGRGGIASLKILRSVLPRVDIAYLADRKNAPYGTKSKSELIRLVSEDARRLCELGAQKILIACCTASTVHCALPKKYKNACIPIISPAAKAAAELTENRKIAVIATEATVRSNSFAEKIKAQNPEITVFSIPCQALVALIERRADEAEIYKQIALICEKIKPLGADTLLLGCTHFSHVRTEFEERLKLKTVDSAAIGAMEIVKITKSEENGKILYT